MLSTIGGRYQIDREIGRGAFGTTFLAMDIQRPGTPECIVKQFTPLQTEPNTLQIAKRLFDREAEMLEKLGKHEQIPCERLRIAAVTIPLIVFLFQKISTKTSEKFSAYENSEYGIKIKYPQNWERQDTFNRFHGDIVMILMPDFYD